MKIYETERSISFYSWPGANSHVYIGSRECRGCDYTSLSIDTHKYQPTFATIATNPRKKVSRDRRQALQWANCKPTAITSYERARYRLLYNAELCANIMQQRPKRTARVRVGVRFTFDIRFGGVWKLCKLCHADLCDAKNKITLRYCSYAHPSIWLSLAVLRSYSSGVFAMQ